MQSHQQEARRRNLDVIRSLNASVSNPQHAGADHISPGVLARLPVQISSMPFYTDAEIDFGVRFSRPMTEAYFGWEFGSIVSPFDRYQDPTWEPFSTAVVHAGGVNAVCRQYFYALWRALNRRVERRDCPPDVKFDSDNSRSMEELYGWVPSRYVAIYARWLQPNEARMTFGRRPCKAAQMQSQFVNHRYPTWFTFSIEDLVGKWTPSSGTYADCLPHTACWLQHSAPLDDRVLRSELVCITSMMKERMKRSAWRAHCIFPVFCYTLNGPQVRVTQAHFDGHFLHLRRTEPVDFIPDDGDCSAVKMLLRWMAAEPIGNTKWINQQDHLDELKPLQSPPSSLAQQTSAKA